MTKRAIDIKAGDILCIEYGAPDNYVSFKVRATFSTDTKVMILADSKVGTETFVLDTKKEVLVTPNV